MKKFIIFLLVILLIIGITVYFTNGKKLISGLDDNIIYKINNQEVTEIKTLDVSEFFSKGIITYNNQKIVFIDYNNNLIWENNNRVFTDNIYIGENYIYKCLENSIEIIDKNNQSYVVTEIQGEIINVSRENNKTYIITKQNNGKNSLYVLDEHNEVKVENKQFDEIITGVSINDKSEGYGLNTLKYSNGKLINTLSYNLIDDMELWSKTIEDEIIIKIKVLNNNVLVIGTENIYFYNSNGSLMWKNSNYNKIKDYEINEENQRIYVLYKQDEKSELLGYNFEGKVKEIYKLPESTNKFDFLNNKMFICNENSISLLHDNKIDTLIEDNNFKITDFYVDNNNKIYLLSKDKLIKGQIK